MPPHTTYIEPFVGGGSVLLNKPRCSVEIASDVDPMLIGMWRWLASIDSWRLDDALGCARYNEATWRYCRDRLAAGPRWVSGKILGDVASYIIRSRMSRGGLGKTFGRSRRLRGGQDEYANSWDTFRKLHLPAICERVSGVEFRCESFAEALSRDQGPDTLVYLDPPYFPETRTARRVYDHEMDETDHRNLLDLIVETASKVILSGYRCPLYDDVLRHWRRIDIPLANHSGQGRTKQRRVESLWLNY